MLVRLTGEVGHPVGVAVPREDDGVVDFVVIQVVEHPVPIRAVAIPGILWEW